MKKKQRKNISLKQTALFSLCFFSSLSASSLSLDDFLNRTIKPHAEITQDNQDFLTTPLFSKEDKVLILSPSSENYFFTLTRSESQYDLSFKSTFLISSFPPLLITFPEEERKIVSLKKTTKPFFLKSFLSEKHLTIASDGVDYKSPFIFLKPLQDGHNEFNDLLKIENLSLPIKDPCFYNIDLKEREITLAHFNSSDASIVDSNSFYSSPFYFSYKSSLPSTSTHVDLDNRINLTSIHPSKEDLEIALPINDTVILSLSPCSKSEGDISFKPLGRSSLSSLNDSFYMMARHPLTTKRAPGQSSISALIKNNHQLHLSLNLDSLSKQKNLTCYQEPLSSENLGSYLNHDLQWIALTSSPSTSFELKNDNLNSHLNLLSTSIAFIDGYDASVNSSTLSHQLISTLDEKIKIKNTCQKESFSPITLIPKKENILETYNKKIVFIKNLSKKTDYNVFISSTAPSDFSPKQPEEILLKKKNLTSTPSQTEIKDDYFKDLLAQHTPPVIQNKDCELTKFPAEKHPTSDIAINNTYSFITNNKNTFSIVTIYQKKHPLLFTYQEPGSLLYEKLFFEEKQTLKLATALLESKLETPFFLLKPEAPFLATNFLNPAKELMLKEIALQAHDYSAEAFSIYYLSSGDYLLVSTPVCLGVLSCTHQIEELLNKKELPNYFCYLEIDEKVLKDKIPILNSQKQEVLVHEKKFMGHQEHNDLIAYQNQINPNIKKHYLLVEKSRSLGKESSPITALKNDSTSLVYSFTDMTPTIKTASTLNHSFRNTTDSLGSNSELNSVNTYGVSDAFSLDLQITPNTKEGGYLFAITLEPTNKKIETLCPQNFLFLIDRSGSIDKTRFQTFKQAVSKALLYLNENDTFNILAFDTEVTKMSHESVFVTQSTKHSAKRYLENQKRGYQYVLPNLSEILLSLEPMMKQSHLPTTVVLLTNGKSLEDLSKQDPLLKKLLKANKNSFTLFTAGCSDNNNALMLEMMSYLNRGEFMHSQTNAAFPRKLAALVKHAGYLAASDVHLSVANKSSDAIIELYPKAPIAPNLYGDRPYTIIGKIDKLSDFDLVLQGRFCENWVLIKKRISFSSARNGGHSIYKDYKTYLAYNEYHQFIEDGKSSHLAEAKKTLQPFNSSFTR